MKTGQPETGTVLKKQIEYIYRRTKRMKSEVVILSCESYEEELIYSTLKKGFTRGMGNFPEKRRKDSAETKSGTKNGSGAGSHYPSGSGQRYRKTVARRRLCASELR